MDERATVPMRRRRLSTEFMAVNVPLTPERAERHVLDTVPCEYEPPAPDFERTGRIEDDIARRIRHQHRRTAGLGVSFVVLATWLGVVLGYALMAMVTR